MKLRYTPRALAELDRMLVYIRDRSPQDAQSVQAHIQAVTDFLVEHPKSGQATSNPNLWRLVSVPYPYLIFYKATKEEVIIIGIRRSARNPASMPSVGHP